MEDLYYFSRFPAFKTVTTTVAVDEFSRLARQMNWRKNSRKYKSERAKFFTSEFGVHFGTEATKLENWQALCLELEIHSPIQSISQCRKVRKPFDLMSSILQSLFFKGT
jgi:hypothetical protein